MSEFHLPSLGADMESAILVEWMVKPGDEVKRGDLVAAIETNKGIIEIEFYEDGVIDEILVRPDETVPIGTVLATYHSEGEEQAPRKTGQAPTKPPQPGSTAAVDAGATGRQRISPAARKRATELSVTLAQLIGSGPGGAVSVKDVEQAAASAHKSMAKELATGPTAMRKSIATAMARAKREIPHYYLGTTIDMSRALEWLEQYNAERPVTERLVYAVLLIKAVALGLRKIPELNGCWIDDHFEPSSAVHVGVAISLRQGGLLAPALHNTNLKDIIILMQEFLDLVTRVRAGRVRRSEFMEPTITVTSLGEEGVETVYPIIYPPQVAIIGFGKIVERPWSVNGMIESRPVVEATLAADHRVSDGHRGGLFLAAINRLLQEPEYL